MISFTLCNWIIVYAFAMFLVVTVAIPAAEDGGMSMEILDKYAL